MKNLFPTDEKLRNIDLRIKFIDAELMLLLKQIKEKAKKNFFNEVKNVK